MSRFSKVVLTAAVFLALAAVLYLRLRFRTPTDKLEPPTSYANREPGPPSGEPRPIQFAAPNMSSSERQTFLAGDYTIVRKVVDLPRGIRKLYTVSGVARIAMADPGEKFEATDMISDLTLPTRRLIFAGVAQDRAFVHYEQGGIAHEYLIDLFRLDSSEAASGLWRGYCGPQKALSTCGN